MRMVICKILTTFALITLLPPVMIVAIITRVAEVLSEFAYTTIDLWKITEGEKD